MSKTRYSVSKIKHISVRLTLIVLCVFGWHQDSKAQRRVDFQPLSERTYLGVHFDDDFLFLFNRDEQYTGGLEVELLWKSKQPKKLTRLFNPYRSTDHNWILVLGTSLYTPYNLSDSLVILNDRPYSSYIYGTIGYTAYDLKKQRRISTELSLGLIGSALPGKVQSILHSIGDSKSTKGWQNKIADKTTFAPNFKLHLTTNLIRVNNLNLLKLDQLLFSHFFETNAGLFQTNLNYGWQLDAFTLPTKINAKLKIKLHSPLYNKKAKKIQDLQINPYINSKIQLVLHNTALEGLPWLDSPYILQHEEVHRLVWQLEGGLRINYRSLYLKYNIIGRSKEFYEFSKNWHIWAGINFGINF